MANIGKPQRVIDTTLMSEGFRNSWQRKVIEATRGNQSQLGAIVICALGRKPKHPPRFLGPATITSDGYLIAQFQKRNGDYVSGFIGSVEDFNNNLRGLADHCKLNDADRKAFFETMKQWIATDYRARDAAKKEGRIV